MKNKEYMNLKFEYWELRPGVYKGALFQVSNNGELIGSSVLGTEESVELLKSRLLRKFSNKLKGEENKNPFPNVHHLMYG